MFDSVKYKVSFVDSRNSKVLYEYVTRPVTLQSFQLESFVSDYKRYLFNHPYTRLIITPLFSVESGELFSNI